MERTFKGTGADLEELFTFPLAFPTKLDVEMGCLMMKDYMRVSDEYL